MLKTALFPLLTLALAAQTAPSAKKEAKAPKKPAVEAKTDAVLAHIGKEAIHQSEFEAFMDMAMPAQQRGLVGAAPAMREQYLKRYLDFRVLAAKARQEKLDAPESFKRKLLLREQETLVQELMMRDGEGLQKQIQVSDEALKAYFESHKQQFKGADKYSARHILIGTQERAEGKALTDEEAKAKAAKVLAELKAGKKIEDLTKEYSDDPGSKDKGGLYEDVPYGQFVPEFEATVKKLAPGEVSDPVKTQFGYHIIKVEKKTPGEAPEFEKVKDKVQQAWTPFRQEEVFQAYVAEARKSLGVTLPPTVPPQPVQTKGSAQ